MSDIYNVRGLGERGVFFLLLIGFFFISLDPNVTNKIINVVGAFSFLLLIYKPCKNFNSSIAVLFFGLFFLGVLDLAWYGFYKNSDVIYRNGYRGYLEAGKLLLSAAFILLLMSGCFLKKSIKYHLIIVFISQIVLVSRAFYQGIYLDAPRISLSAMNGNIGQMGAATIAAYMITFNALYASIVFLRGNIKYKWLFFYINFFLSLSAIIMTGTRSAIITYPIMIVLMLIVHYRRQKNILIKVLSAILLILLSSGLIFNKEIKSRANEINHDIFLYVNKNSSVSSIGARFSMIKAGYESAPKDFSWQSLEERAQKIETLSKSDKIYEGATLFLDVHMHNEIIEALSTKGIIGVVALILFYFSLIYYCIKSREYLLLVFPLSIILFGISDVITHAKPIPSSWIVSLLLSILFLSAEKREKNKDE
ncbi:O-antigen ligase family protein [Leminorella grimontii]|uniref:O-antigen ligase family protein n=1 Tax=Leminorella grimontii TaxID=82981 RepID=UPI002088AB9C|nr:O-antigen ligase family protein [Leminorella grimontii]GKX60924.1 ligase [Leminorella grimontii]